MIDSARGTTRAEDAQGTPTQSHISPSILVYEDTPEPPKAVPGTGVAGQRCEDRVLTPNTVELIPTLGALFP